MPSVDTHKLQLPSGESAAVSSWGAHVLSWTDASGRERLYLTPIPTQPGRAIRGGVPVCFPQFSSRGPLAKHGFARTSVWRVIDASATDLRLQLTDSDETRALWPHRFELDLAIRLRAGALELQLEVANTDAQPWAFAAALHTYLRVEEVAQAKLHGLQGLVYEDALENGAVHIADQETPNLSMPIDRVYRGASRPLALRDGARQLRVTQQGFEDVVVWNPGTTGAAQLGDMPAADAPHMLCVEAGRICAPVTLQPGQRWTGWQRLDAA